MPETHSNPLDDPTANPFEVAAQAAADIARLTGVEKHDIALTLGSGWGKAADIIGETVATIPATEVTGFSKPALEGHVVAVVLHVHEAAQQLVVERSPAGEQ